MASSLSGRSHDRAAQEDRRRWMQASRMSGTLAPLSRVPGAGGQALAGCRSCRFRTQSKLVVAPVKILLTGATGFIGSAFLKLALQRGHQLAGLIRPGKTPAPTAAAPPQLVWMTGTL